MSNRVQLLNILKKRWHIYLMLFPTMAILLLFVYYPLITGIQISFLKFRFSGGSSFIGLDNYRSLFTDRLFQRDFVNTIFLGIGNIIGGIICSLVLALLLNEIARGFFKRSFQTILYIPHLFSWITIGAILIVFMSPTTGQFNALLKLFGIEPIFFFGKPEIAKPLFIILHIWKHAGYTMVIFIASIVGIDPEMYEAATLDGANRFQKITKIILPMLQNSIKTVAVLQSTSLFLLFEQVWVLAGENGAIRPEVETVMNFMYKWSIRRINLGLGGAMSVTIIVIGVLVTLIVKTVTKFDTSFDQG
jgi:putative aldouronate transport system permease protein